MLTGDLSKGGGSRRDSEGGGTLGVGARTTGVARGVIVLIQRGSYPGRPGNEVKTSRIRSPNGSSCEVGRQFSGVRIFCKYSSQRRAGS